MRKASYWWKPPEPLGKTSSLKTCILTTAKGEFIYGKEIHQFCEVRFVHWQAAALNGIWASLGISKRTWDDSDAVIKQGQGENTTTPWTSVPIPVGRWQYFNIIEKM